MNHHGLAQKVIIQRIFTQLRFIRHLSTGSRSPPSISTPIILAPNQKIFSKGSQNDVVGKYKLVTAQQLRGYDKRPVNVRMLTRDFIEDSLYNPHYGYFQRFTRFTPSADRNLRYPYINEPRAFFNQWTRQTQFPPASEYHDVAEFIQPFYAQAIARYLLVNYKLNLYPYSDLIIYELVAGGDRNMRNKTDQGVDEQVALMINILDYIRETQPDVYLRTRYRIMSTSLSTSAKPFIKAANLHGHDAVIEIEFDEKFPNSSMLPYIFGSPDDIVREPCYILAVNNFLSKLPHDLIRYDTKSLQAHQCQVVINEKNEFSEVYTPELDPWADTFLTLRDGYGSGRAPEESNIPSEHEHLIAQSHTNSDEYSHMTPIKFNPKTILGIHPLSIPLNLYRYLTLSQLTPSEFIPSKYVTLLYLLRRKFPSHRLLASGVMHHHVNETKASGYYDVAIPTAIAGYCAPKVSTVINNHIIPVQTYLTMQGYFDIEFPADFELLAGLYKKVCGMPIEHCTNQEFMHKWAELDETVLANDVNPLLSLHSNVSFLFS
ncbi:DUF185-domain-containing protein [Nadsonia fulvescens var. elongata DSM 6958]|uniref:Protein arginine methyltransferase NDUFAF7 n=1 Tax=Nadsonia fulvescens var. elongata DSM 6958 TaxID=857566 RepID=A0A1E3PSD1_9ASCO|nr:DUF185-domain-containing protein [Nadsonia fulvescens var. elongata DSM 6958]